MQSQHMAAMAMNANMGGPVGEGTPIMGNAQRQMDNQTQNRTHLNTYIYDYFKRNKHHKLAQLMIESEMEMNLQQADSAKRSPNPRNVNGVGAVDNLPEPMLPDHQLADNSFLMDWWVQFWDIWGAARSRSINAKSLQYINHSRSLAQMQTEQRTQRMMMNGGMNGGMNAQYQNMMRAMPNGIASNDLKRAAAMNNRNPNGANPMANVNQQMKNHAMMAQQMQRDGSQMDLNGQRPQSPGSTENAPSPNKRPRVEGGMNQAGMAGSQFTEFAQQGQGLQQKTIEGMNAAVQGSPMNHQGLDGETVMFAGNPQRGPGSMPAAPGQPQGNHALQDYQMQLMLLEQQNKKRLLMARQEQDSMTGGPPQGHTGVGAPGFPPAMSPQGSRAGPSPNPTDQMKRGTPKLNQQGLPSSPMPDGTMQQQRNSPIPFDPSQMPPGMPPQQFTAGYPQIPGNPMMRPPSSHPGNFNGQMSQAQMEAIRRNPAMQNGGWPQGGPPQAMMQNQGQPMGGPGGPMNNPQRNNMPPPPAPPAGEQPRAEPSPSQPAAPPTPSTTSKANPKKKNTGNDKKKPANKKGAATGAAQAASSEDPPPTPTPSTPMTPVHPKSFNNGPNGQPPAAPAPVQPAAPPPQPPSMDPGGPFGNLGDDNLDFDALNPFPSDSLDNFDFDSFLHVGGDDPGFGLGTDFSFGDTAEVGDGI